VGAGSAAGERLERLGQLLRRARAIGLSAIDARAMCFPVLHVKRDDLAVGRATGCGSSISDSARRSGSSARAAWPAPTSAIPSRS